ncbi:hypothetical protein GPALN_011688 [Globodera pallida]|nr:hypothetical protein GPALN_011688 [Globodera pallida]
MGENQICQNIVLMSQLLSPSRVLLTKLGKFGTQQLKQILPNFCRRPVFFSPSSARSSSNKSCQNKADWRFTLFEYSPNQVNPNIAVHLIAELALVPCKERTVRGDGGHREPSSRVRQPDKADWRFTLFEYSPNQVNPNIAVHLIAELALVPCEERTVRGDGGHRELGHPRVYVNLVNPNIAVHLIAELALVPCEERTVRGDGGHRELGHPRVYVNLELDIAHIEV